MTEDTLPWGGRQSLEDHDTCRRQVRDEAIMRDWEITVRVRTTADIAKKLEDRILDVLPQHPGFDKETHRRAYIERVYV